MITRSQRIALEEILEDAVRFDAPLSRHTSLRIGGPADALAQPPDRASLAKLLGLCAAQRIPHTFIGAGFNTLVLDGGIDGVVIQLRKLQRIEERPGGAIRVEAGVSHARLTKFCIERGLSGLEFGAGIPGSIGGWAAMNAGIGVRELVDVVLEAEVMSPTGRARRHLGRHQLQFSYRALRGLASGSAILSLLLAVSPSDPNCVRTEVDRMLAKRAETQPLDVPSCGSVFKNPPGNFAGQLIEAAGLKGEQVGGAVISPVHANFIANLGNASASDVLALIARARDAVHERTGIELQTEVRIVGRSA